MPDTRRPFVIERLKNLNSIASLAGTAYRNRGDTGRLVAQQLLASLRQEQSFGLSLKKAVKRGLVRIVYSEESSPHLRTAKVVPA